MRLLFPTLIRHSVRRNLQKKLCSSQFVNRRGIHFSSICYYYINQPWSYSCYFIMYPCRQGIIRMLRELFYQERVQSVPYKYYAWGSAGLNRRTNGLIIYVFDYDSPKQSNSVFYTGCKLLYTEWFGSQRPSLTIGFRSTYAFWNRSLILCRRKKL